MQAIFKNIIVDQPTTPETANKVGRALTHMQVEHNGADTATAAVFEVTIMRDMRIIHSMELVLEAICKHMRRYNFYPAQIVALANILVDRFAPPMAMPVDDDDVVFVGVTLQAEVRLTNASAALTNANSAMISAQSAVVQANQCHGETTSARNAARALLESAATADNAASRNYDFRASEAEQALRAVQAAEAEHAAARAECESSKKKARKD
jgi:hypothetical protein